MNNSICTLFDNILIDIHKFKSLHYIIVDSVSPFLLKEMLLKDIKEYIEKSESGQKEFNENIFEKVKKLFEK